ncbi:hypothetical protein [Zavarzinella formosa]|uniref:hypothetical protein n=1 Tax=Zavarzinella formosa TaxID=360055 RepID=UPI0003687484|nr:hypothetical protein [Zavarzinella formosa]
MALIARIIGLSLLTSWLGAQIGLQFLRQSPDDLLAAFVLGCVGAIIGAVAGAAREIVLVLGRKEHQPE